MQFSMFKKEIILGLSHLTIKMSFVNEMFNVHNICYVTLMNKLQES